MAHVTGATFHLIHGRTNATYLPHVVRYNGTVPTKLTSWPKYEHYIAPAVSYTHLTLPTKA